jgi:hypothetical protein
MKRLRAGSLRDKLEDVLALGEHFSAIWVIGKAMATWLSGAPEEEKMTKEKVEHHQVPEQCISRFLNHCDQIPDRTP